MSEKAAPLYVVCSTRPRVGKTLVSRMLTEFYLIDSRPVAAFDLADEGAQLVNYLPMMTKVVDIRDIRGQVAFFDQLIADTRCTQIIDLSHRAFDNFFSIVREIRFFEEALSRTIEPLLLFITDAEDLNTLKSYEMLRDEFCEAASLLPVRNQIEPSAILTRNAPFNAKIPPASLDIPLLNLSLKAHVAQQSFSFARFWQAPASELPISMDDELAGWVGDIFSQFRSLGLTLGWEDPAADLPVKRPPRLRGREIGPYADNRSEAIHSLASHNEEGWHQPEEVLRFAPKKVRNVGSFHPARNVLRAAIAELELAKVKHDQHLQAQQQAREVALASERMLAALGEADRGAVLHEYDEKGAAPRELLGRGLPLRFVTRRAATQISRERAKTTKAAYERSCADLHSAKIAVQESTQKVVSAAIDLLVAEAFKQANALEVAWNDVWRIYDRVSALADCELRHAEKSHRIKLPPEMAELIEAIAALDRRSFPGQHNNAAAQAGEVWCRWFEALMTNAEAEAIFEREG
jgi:hypothetical protein